MTRYKMLIDGMLVDGDAVMDVVNPATEEILAECPRASPCQLEDAIAAAKRSFEAWAAMPVIERAQALQRFADRIEEHAAELARLLTQEQGKPLSESEGELAFSVIFIRQFAAMRLPARVLEENDTRRVESHRVPLGVVAAIVPWNFPVLIALFKMAPALLAGNSIVLKPAPTTPLTALRIAALCQDIFPPGVLNIIADANDLGSLLTAHPDVAKISFTGSTATGKKVMTNAATSIKRVTLELGGNDAGIVLPDADPDTVAPDIFAGAFMNAGQVCIALKRLYVHESLYDAMCAALAKIADASVVGDGLESGTQIGPIQNAGQFEKVKAYLEDARKTGRIIAGGELLNRRGYFLRPTIVRDVSDGDRIVDEEQFGPILPVISYSDIDDAVRRANNSPYGLGASIWSGNPQGARDLALRIEAGTVWINKHLDFGPTIPFGGAKQSGLGIEFSEEGLAEYTQLRIVNSAR